MGEIAQEVGAMLLADIAHIAGLVATGVHPSPVPYADFVTTTTHKTLRGPRGGLVMCKAKYAKEIDSQAFPGIQGGPLMHVIAAKAVCFHEALQPSFKAYQEQITVNAKALAAGMIRNGFRLVSGGTDNHLMLLDLRNRNLTGKDAQEALDLAGITVPVLTLYSRHDDVIRLAILAFKLTLKRMVKSIAHGMALSHRPHHAGMWGGSPAYIGSITGSATDSSSCGNSTRFITLPRS